MESNENNNSDNPNTETERTDAGDGDGVDGQPAASSMSTSPKRCKLDPNVPSTSK